MTTQVTEQLREALKTNAHFQDFVLQHISDLDKYNRGWCIQQTEDAVLTMLSYATSSQAFVEENDADARLSLHRQVTNLRDLLQAAESLSNAGIMLEGLADGTNETA